MAEPLFAPSLLANLERDAVHENDLAAALRALRDRCAEEGIPLAVIGALAMRQHGYSRFTEVIDIVTTPDGLDRIHERLVGRGLMPRAPGLRKKLKDTIHRVGIDVIQVGEHAGSPESPVTYPEPSSEAFTSVGVDGIAYATLPALITFKLAAGTWGHRPRDLADVQELIKANGLDEGFTASLPEPLHAAFVERVQGSRQERDIE